MKASVFLLVVAALFAVSFADEPEPVFNREYMVNYVDGLYEAGVLPRVQKEEIKAMSLKELLDVAIEGLGTIIEYLPSQADMAKKTKTFYEDKRAKL